MAYRVEPGEEGAVLAGLDQREKGGYDRFEVELCFDRSQPTAAASASRLPQPGVMYVANSANADYLGSALVADIARQVSQSHGPSGGNTEYVLRLADSLREIGAQDDHVFAVEAALRRQLDGR